VVSVPAARDDISIKFSKQNVFRIIFPSEKQVEHQVKEEVYRVLLERLKEKATKQGIDMGAVPELSMKVHVHAECTLLAYHLQHPEIETYHYFGGSKLACHGCSMFFRSFNGVAESFGLAQFFIKGSHNKIYLRWPCPFLLSQEQRRRLRPTDPSLDNQVRREMVAALDTELAAYVNELRVMVENPLRPQSDNTNASGDSQVSSIDAEAAIYAMIEDPGKSAAHFQVLIAVI
jgi:hypothetical protein